MYVDSALQSKAHPAALSRGRRFYLINRRIKTTTITPIAIPISKYFIAPKVKENQISIRRGM
jgi:hypothetical protein